MDVGNAGVVGPVNASCNTGISNIHIGQKIHLPYTATISYFPVGHDA